MPGKTRNPANMCQTWICFNEAPAKCRGKLHFPVFSRLALTRFNEAPAKCRGKQYDQARRRDEYDWLQ